MNEKMALSTLTHAGVAVLAAGVLAVGFGCAKATTESESKSPLMSSPAVTSRTELERASLNGWAVGDQGIVLATTDGGDHWKRQVSGVARDLEDVDFADANRGCAVGTETVLTTSDGGKTWERERFAQSGRHTWVLCVDLADGERGWIGTSESSLVSTSDGGTTWSPQPLPLEGAPETNPAWIYDIAVSKTGYGWAVGGDDSMDYGAIFATSDGGRVWQSQHLAGETSPLLGGQLLLAVASSDAQRACAVGWDILLTTDGGANWSAAPRHPRFFDLQDVEFVDASHAWAVGDTGSGGDTLGGLVLATSDGGQTWTKQRHAMTRYLSGVVFTTSTDGWVTGCDAHDRGLIMRTTDGGKTWRRQPVGDSPPLSGVAFEP